MPGQMDFEVSMLKCYVLKDVTWGPSDTRKNAIFQFPIPISHFFKLSFDSALF